MTEGTKSYLFGCHSFIMHPLCIIYAWKKHYGTWPNFKQIVCIFLHDIGIIGLDYLSKGKKGHWVRGANLANDLFGPDAFYFCAGHSTGSGTTRSKMWIADKKSWLYAPKWWLHLNKWVEGWDVHPDDWVKAVKKDLEKESPTGAHGLYLELTGKRRTDSGDC